MTKRFGSKTRPWVYRYLATRDGEQCAICRRPAGQNRALQIHHIDHNSKNDDPSNLCFLCYKCNKELQVLGVKERILLMRRVLCVKKSECESVCDNQRGNPETALAKDSIEYSRGSLEMRANERFEIPFRSWILQKVNLEGYFPRKEAIVSGAEITGASTMSIRRYLEKLTSEAGALMETRNNWGVVLVLRNPTNSKNLDVNELIKQALATKIKKPRRRD